MFRASLPGRIISLSVAAALVMGGLIPILGLAPSTWIPFALLIPITGCIFGTVLAVGSHSSAAAAVAVAFPLLLWPYSMVLMLVATTYRQYGWALVAAGAVMTALTAASGLKRNTEAPAATAKASLA